MIILFSMFNDGLSSIPRAKFEDWLNARGKIRDGNFEMVVLLVAFNYCVSVSCV